MADNIFAPITSLIGGSTIIIRVSGANVLEVRNIFKIKKELLPRVATLVELKRGVKHIDKAVVTYFKGPNSYTGEDVMEISLHGSKVIYHQMIEILSRQKNFRFAEPGEFTKRAFVNKKIDLMQAEAISDLVESETELQAAQALRQLSGKYSKRFDYLRSEIINIRSLVEAYIDFPEEDIPEEKLKAFKKLIVALNKEISFMLQDRRVGERIRDGVKISIIGPPNSGKSSLINNLTGRDIAIVSDIAGTTRDLVEARLDIAGFPVVLTDTAGLRDTQNKIEKIGIERAIDRAKNADFKILVLSIDEVKQKENFKEFIGDNTIILINKTDLAGGGYKDVGQTIYSSIKDNKGIDNLIKKIEKMIREQYKIDRDSVITRERHRVLLTRINSELKLIDFADDLEIIAERLRIVSNLFGQILGRIDIEDILDNIFSTFCIGK